MTPQKAIEATARAFPFKDHYFQPGQEVRDIYHTIATTVQRLLPSGASVMDFGCGPCDKTAVLAFMGYRCTGLDDLEDAWHREGENLRRIHGFAEQVGIRLIEGSKLPDERAHSFDMIMSHDCLEHLHNSPREILQQLIGFLKPGGYLYITVPNAVNLRKRIAVLRGRTNYPPYQDYFWYPGPWRGHVREYVKQDLVELAAGLGLELVEVGGCDHMVQSAISNRLVRKAWVVGTTKADSLKDSVYLIARKPAAWSPPDVPEEIVQRFRRVQS